MHSRHQRVASTALVLPAQESREDIRKLVASLKVSSLTALRSELLLEAAPAP